MRWRRSAWPQARTKFGEDGPCSMCRRVERHGEHPLRLGCACSGPVHWSCFREAATGWSRCGLCGIRYGGAFAMRAAAEWARLSRVSSRETQISAEINRAAELASVGRYEDAIGEYAAARARTHDATAWNAAFRLEIDIGVARVEMLLANYTRAAELLRSIVSALTLEDRRDGPAGRKARGLWAEAVSLKAEHAELPIEKRTREFRRALGMLTELAATTSGLHARAADEGERARLRYERALNDARAAHTLLAKGDDLAALDRFETCIHETEFLGQHALVLSLRHGRAICLARLDDGDLDDAESEMLDVIEEYTRLYSTSHPLVARAEADLSRILDT